MIYYQAYGKDAAGDYDPTLISNRQNWMMELREGGFRCGKAEGYQR